MASTRLARANHVLVPGSSAERDRYRLTRTGRVVGLVASVLRRMSSEGGLLLALLVPSAIVTLDARRSQSYVAWGALFGLLLASFVASFAYRLRGVTARLLVPRRVARGVPVRLTVALEHAGTQPFASLRVRGPFLPWDGRWVSRRAGLPLLSPGERRHVELVAAFLERGPHHLDPIRVQALVPLGLSLGPPLSTSSPRFLVVPRVANVTSVTLPRARTHHPGGVPRATQLADSRELASVRPYRPGDPVRDLHPKTWARTGVPHVREYQEEYFTHLAVVVEAADAAARKKGEDETLESALSLAAGVVAQLLRGETLVDLLVFGHRATDGASANGGPVDHEAVSTVELGRGRGTLEVALDRLAIVARGGPLAPDGLVATLASRKDRYAALVLVTSSWDERRAALATRLEALGPALLVLVVTREGEAAPPAPIRAFSAARIAAGEPLPC